MTSSSSFCWGCGVKCSMRCGRCKNAFYCSQDCISSSWAFHRSHCHKEFGTLLNTLYSKNMCEVYYDDIKGYGLRAICDMPAMTKFAVFHSPAMGIVETHLSGQHDYSIAVPNSKKGPYLPGDVFSKSGKLVGPMQHPHNASLVNCTVDVALLLDCVEKMATLNGDDLCQYQKKIKEMVFDSAFQVSNCGIIGKSDENKKNKTITMMTTIKEVKIGERLEMMYGSHYWMYAISIGKFGDKISINAQYAAQSCYLSPNILVSFDFIGAILPADGWTRMLTIPDKMRTGVIVNKQFDFEMDKCVQAGNFEMGLKMIKNTMMRISLYFGNRTINEALFLMLYDRICRDYEMCSWRSNQPKTNTQLKEAVWELFNSIGFHVDESAKAAIEICKQITTQAEESQLSQ